CSKRLLGKPFDRAWSWIKPMHCEANVLNELQIERNLFSHAKRINHAFLRKKILAGTPLSFFVAEGLVGMLYLNTLVEVSSDRSSPMPSQEPVGIAYGFHYKIRVA